MQFTGRVEQIPDTESIRQLIFNPSELMLWTKIICIELLKSSEQVVSAG